MARQRRALLSSLLLVVTFIFLARALLTFFSCEKKKALSTSRGADEGRIRVWLILHVAKVQNQAKLPSLAIHSPNRHELLARVLLPDLHTVASQYTQRKRHATQPMPSSPDHTNFFTRPSHTL